MRGVTATSKPSPAAARLLQLPVVSRRTPSLALSSAAPHRPGRQSLATPAPQAAPLQPLRSRGCSAQHTRQRCTAAFDDRSGTPDAQQPAFQEQPQPQSTGGAPPGGPGGSSNRSSPFARTDAWALGLARWLVDTVRLPLRLILEFLRNMREAFRLIPRLHSPPPGAVIKRSAIVMVVVVLFLLYVHLIDSILSYIPRFIAYTHSHPEWLRSGLGAAAAAVRGALAAARKALPVG